MISKERRAFGVFALIAGSLLIALLVLTKKISHIRQENRERVLALAGSPVARPVSPALAEAAEPAAPAVALPPPTQAAPAGSEPQAEPVKPPELSGQQLVALFQERPIIEACSWIQYAQPEEAGAEARLRTLADVALSTVKFAPQLLQLHLPVSQGVIADIEDDRTLLGNLEYAVALYEVKKELEDNLETAKQVMRQAYLAAMVTRVMLHNPSLIGEGSALALCEEFADVDSEKNIDEMKEQLQGFLIRAQVQPEEVGYNPNFEPQITIEWSGEGFVYKTGPVR